MSKTPRTDEHLRRKEENGDVVIVSSEFARQLEAELAEARAEIERKDALIEQMRNCHNCGTSKKKNLCDRCLSWGILGLPKLFNWSPKAALAAERGE